ncbi:MAG: integrin alpha [Planctomycetota bacterium]
MFRSTLSLSLALAALSTPLAAQDDLGEVLIHKKISSIDGTFSGGLDNGDLFGGAIAALGDLDGDGIGDYAVGAIRDDDGGTDAGAVWILFLRANGTVKSFQKISALEGGLVGPVAAGDAFGVSLAALGDLDSDGVRDLAVGSFLDDSGGPNRGAVYVLFLNANGTVKAEQKISSTSGGLGTPLDDEDRFGHALARLSPTRIAVGILFDDDGGADRGAVLILDLTTTTGMVAGEAKISSTAGGFGGVLDDGDWFGTALADAGDINGDTNTDLLVGARKDDDGGTDRGALWVLFLDAGGAVLGQSKISHGNGGFSGSLANLDAFGTSAAKLGEVGGDTVVAVGCPFQDDGGTDRGALWLLFLDSTGTCTNSLKISDTVGNFAGQLANSDQFGYALVARDDANEQFGFADLIVGARFADNGGADRGRVHLLRISEGPFTDLGNGLLGSNGMPELTGTGTLVAGTAMSINLVSAKQSASAALVVGISNLYANFKGGVMVGDPLIIFSGLTTTPSGTATLGTPSFPSGLSLFTMYFQYWITESPGVFSASNGLAMTAP